MPSGFVLPTADCTRCYRAVTRIQRFAGGRTGRDTNMGMISIEHPGILRFIVATNGKAASQKTDLWVLDEHGFSFRELFYTHDPVLRLAYLGMIVVGIVAVVKLLSQNSRTP